MPCLTIQTNIEVEQNTTADLLRKISASVAATLGKPESYVMVALHTGIAMSFAGNSAPLAYLELKSLGLPEERTTEFSAQLCQLMEEVLGIEKERIYIEFASPPRHMFGWSGRTF